MVYRGQLRVVFGNLQKSLEIFGNFGGVRVIAGGVSKCWVIFVPSFVEGCPIHTNRLQWNGTQSIRFPLVKRISLRGLFHSTRPLVRLVPIFFIIIIIIIIIINLITFTMHLIGTNGIPLVKYVSLASG